MIIDNIYKSEIIIVYIEQIEDVEEWRPLLLELSEKGLIVTVNEERLVTDDEFMEEPCSTSIEIVCTVEEFIQLVPRIKDLDEEGMLSIKRTYQELEDYYYKEFKPEEDEPQ